MLRAIYIFRNSASYSIRSIKKY